MTTHYQYSFSRVSKTTDIDASASQYRELRLQALQASPESFSSTYTIEIAFRPEDWISRLSLPGVETFVCRATPVTTDSVPIAGKEIWVGQVTIRGPCSSQAFTLPPSSGQPAPNTDDVDEKWQMYSLFTLPSHRGHGVAKGLCLEAINYLKAYRSTPPNVCIRLMVKPGNLVTVGLYKHLGFVEAGMCTLAEALIANGDEKLLPVGHETDEKYSKRSGLIMTKHFSRER